MSSDCHHCSKIQDHGLTLSYQFTHAVLETDVKTTVVVVVSLLNSEVNCF